MQTKNGLESSASTDDKIGKTIMHFYAKKRYLIRELSSRMKQRGAEGISKFAVKLRCPIQETEIVYVAPKHLQS